MLTSIGQKLIELNFISEPKKVNEYKRLFQGGLQFFPVKFGVATQVEFNSGIYVTRNEVSFILNRWYLG